MNKKAWMGVLSAAALLTACGGGDDNDDPAPPTETPLALSGTAATGAPIAGATVEAQCATGSGTATTGSDGSYAIGIAGGALPCVLKVPASDGTTLYSAVGGTGRSGTANLSPLTQLVLAQATGTTGDRVFAGEGPDMDGAAAAKALADAVVALQATLAAGGIDLGTLNPLSDPLTAGSAHDQKIEALQAALATGKVTLADLETTVMHRSPLNTLAATPVTEPHAKVWPAAQMLLRPSEASCQGLRSGRYRVIDFQRSASGAATGVITIDSQAKTVVQTEGDTAGFSAGSTPCRYTVDDGNEFVVSQAGVIGIRSPDGTVGMAFPDETHTVAELTGTWNFVGMDLVTGSTTTYRPDHGTVTFDAAGKVTAATYCLAAGCSVLSGTSLPQLSVKSDADGLAFDNATEGSSERMFAYRAGGGELMLATIGGDGSIGIFSRPRKLEPAAVGSVSSNWGFDVAPTLLASGGVLDFRSTVLSVDAAVPSYVRRRDVTLAGTATTADETMVMNLPFDGFVHRDELTLPTADGRSFTSRRVEILPMRGLGFSTVSVPTVSLFELSINKP